MTKDELYKAFKIELDKNSNSLAYGGCPAFIDAEIDYYLNKALYSVVIEKFTGGGSDIKFEGSVKRISDLERLVKTDLDLEVEKDYNNSVYLNNLLNRLLDGDGRMLFVQAVLKWGDYSYKNSATVKLVSNEDVKSFMHTHDNNPWIENPVGIIKNNRLSIYYDPVSMESDKYRLDLTYIKHPHLISKGLPYSAIDELPDQTWYEIINRAVQFALENIESPRLNTNVQLNNTEE